MRDRLRWLAVPIAAYLVITLALPAANGAAAHRDLRALGHHAMWVVLGCTVVIVAIGVIGAVLELFRRGAKPYGATPQVGNTRTTPRVSPGGMS